MDPVLEILKTAFAKSFGATLGAVIVYGALAGIVLMLALPVWLLLKRRSGLSVEVRSEIARELDAVDRVATSFYEVLIYGAIAGMTGLAVFFYLVIRDDYWRDFLLLYGGVVYLIGMLWGIGQLYWIRRRRAGEPARSIQSVLSQLGTKIQIDVQTSEPQVIGLDDAALERARQHLAAGGSIDEACALVVPQYPAMNRVLQAVLRKAVQTALAARAK